MKILVTTTKKGAIQGRTFELLNETTNKGFYNAITDTNKNVTIWNVNGDWSEIGVQREGFYKMTYYNNITINE